MISFKSCDKRQILAFILKVGDMYVGDCSIKVSQSSLHSLHILLRIYYSDVLINNHMTCAYINILHYNYSFTVLSSWSYSNWLVTNIVLSRDINFDDDQSRNLGFLQLSTPCALLAFSRI